MNEKELVRLSKSGDKDAFCKLYNLYYERLYRFAFYKLGNVDDAKDAVSDCVLTAFEGISKLKNDGAFSAWLFKIMYRVCCKAIGEQSKSRLNDDIEESDLAYSISYESNELRFALAQLSDEESSIVLLSIIAGYSSEEISKIMGIKPATIRSKQSRALKKMREYLE